MCAAPTGPVCPPPRPGREPRSGVFPMRPSSLPLLPEMGSVTGVDGARPARLAFKIHRVEIWTTGQRPPPFSSTEFLGGLTASWASRLRLRGASELRPESLSARIQPTSVMGERLISSPYVAVTTTLSLWRSTSPSVVSQLSSGGDS
jgi:hypothetical protein